MKELNALATTIMTSGQDVTTSIMESIPDLKSVDTPWADPIIHIVKLSGCIATVLVLAVLFFVFLSKGDESTHRFCIVSSSTGLQDIRWRHVIGAIALAILVVFILYRVIYFVFFG